TYLPGDLLVKMDIMTMAHGLEARSPFLDHKFVEMAATLPTRMKIRRGRTKYILRRAFEGTVPRRILGRGKMGFGVPLAGWFRGELREFAREILLDPSALRWSPCWKTTRRSGRITATSSGASWFWRCGTGTFWRAAAGRPRRGPRPDGRRTGVPLRLKWGRMSRCEPGGTAPRFPPLKRTRFLRCSTPCRS
ncbi:MAG: asparagine synthase-related protein, partial [Nitrospinota bacterium]